MENRNGLVVAGCVTQSSTKAEREAALAMLPEMSDGRGRTTLGADKGYQERAFLERLAKLAGGTACGRIWREAPALAGRIAGEERNDPGFEQSQKKRKRVEQVFGWIKEVAECGRPSFADGVGGMDVPLGAQRTQSAAYAAPAAGDHGLGEGKGIATGSKSSLTHKIARTTGGKKLWPDMFCRKTSIFPQPVERCPDTNRISLSKL